MKRRVKGFLLGLLMVSSTIGLSACGTGDEKADQVVIYSNADEEAVESIKKSLDAGGFGGQYIVQTFGTSELGGKIMAEGKDIEADLVTMSSYFLESAQEKNEMFESLEAGVESLEGHPDYYAPILANTGAVFVNTEVLEEKGLEKPSSIKDLTKDEYKDLVSIPNIMDSSTAWLLIQSIINEYPEEEAKDVIKGLVENCGPHVESSGSGPIKKVRAGEVAAGFGLRHQAVEDYMAGSPIEFIDPTEGNFSLTEALALVKKDDEVNDLARDMAEVILKDARKELIDYYPVALYEGETVEAINKPANPKQFSKPLTVELLKEHQDFFNENR